MEVFTSNHTMAFSSVTVGDRISALCELLKSRVKLPQSQIAIQADLLEKEHKEKLSKQFLKFTESELSLAKKSITIFSDPENPNAKQSREYRIYLSLLEILLFLGYDLVSWGINDNKLVISYHKEESTIPAKNAGQIKTSNLLRQGLTQIHEHEPSEDIKGFLKQTFELKILQSCLFGWESDWEKILKEALSKGTLTKVKFLLAQPYSTTAQMRAHTISNHEEPLSFFNDRAQGIIGQILDLADQYREKINPNSKKPYDIEVRLYYNPSPIPIYQCLDANGGNIKTYFGIFWENISSRDAPHFEIVENQGSLINNLNAHFKKLWERNLFLDRDFIDWQKILGTRNNIKLSSGEATGELFFALRKAFSLRAFSNFHRGKPNWRSFICRYHNRTNELQKFYLEIDVRRQIARIRDTPLGNTYYGWAIRNSRSYSIFVHTCRSKPLDRIIYINFYIGDTELDSVDKVLFGVYNNSDPLSFTPYAQVISIWKARRLDRDKLIDDLPVHLLMEFEDFAETIKEKKIDIQHESQILENIQTKKTDYNENNDETNGAEKSTRYPLKGIEGSYVFRFEQNRDKFYYYLNKETERAKEQIFILGQGPSYFPNGRSKEKEKYLNSHLELAKDIKIHRILLKSKVNTDFKNMLITVKNRDSVAPNYQIYLLLNEVPVLFDLILIDPESQNQTAILIYSKQNIDKTDIYPIKMEVLRGIENLGLISSFFQHCKEYINMPSDKIKILSTIEEIGRCLDDGA